MRRLLILFLALLVVAVPIPPGFSQSGFSQSDDLKVRRNEIEALKEEQRAIRKETQDLGNSLRDRGGPFTRDVRDLTIGVGQSPAQGNNSAVLARAVGCFGRLEGVGVNGLDGEVTKDVLQYVWSWM